MTPLESARAKLNNPELGALTPVEIVALLQASRPEPKSKMIPAFIEEVLDATLDHNRETARANLAHLFAEKEVTVTITKTWSDEDFNKIAGFGVPK